MRICAAVQLNTSNGLFSLIISHLPVALFFFVIICDYLAWVASRRYAVLLRTSNGSFMLIVSHLLVSLLLFYLLDYFTWKLPEAMRAAKDKRRVFVLIVFSCRPSLATCLAFINGRYNFINPHGVIHSLHSTHPK